MRLCNVAVRLFVWGLATFAGGRALYAQRVAASGEGEGCRVKVLKAVAGSAAHKNSGAALSLMPFDIAAAGPAAGNGALPYAADSVSLRYSHNFQSGIPAMDNYLDIKILDATGKKMKKDAVRAALGGHPEALRRYNSGVRLYTAAAFLGIANIGVLACRLSQPERKYVWLTVGLACSSGVVICRLAGTARLKSAVRLHNAATVDRHAPDFSLNFGVCSSGAPGLMLNF